MRSIYAKYALLNDELEIKQNIIIHTKDNRIKQIEHSPNDVKNNILILPAFFNAHVHFADIGIRGVEEKNLAKLVGAGGIKHQYLQGLTNDELLRNYRRARKEAIEGGVLGWADFREGGISGLHPYIKEQHHNFIAYARPSLNTIDNLPKGVNIGFRDVNALSDEAMIKISRKAKSEGRKVQIHASEDYELRKLWIDKYGKSDIKWAIDELSVDAIVHGCYASSDDIRVMQETGTGLITCPTSNLFFNLKLPPLKEIISKYPDIPIALGTDNAMVNQLNMFKDMRLLREEGIVSSTIVKTATMNSAKLNTVDWGIQQGNSNFIGVQIPNGLKENQIFDFITTRLDTDDIKFKIFEDD